MPNFCSVWEVCSFLTSGDWKRRSCCFWFLFCSVRNCVLWCDVYLTKWIGHFSQLHLHVRNLGLKQFCCKSRVGVWVKLFLRFHIVRNKSCWDANNAEGLSKQQNSYQSSPTFLCFESPTALFESQHNLFRTMWPAPAKGLFFACFECWAFGFCYFRISNFPVAARFILAKSYEKIWRYCAVGRL